MHTADGCEIAKAILFLQEAPTKRWNGEGEFSSVFIRSAIESCGREFAFCIVSGVLSPFWRLQEWKSRSMQSS
jgi:hypothetical protein